MVVMKILGIFFQTKKNIFNFKNKNRLVESFKLVLTMCGPRFQITEAIVNAYRNTLKKHIKIRNQVEKIIRKIGVCGEYIGGITAKHVSHDIEESFMYALTHPGIIEKLDQLRNVCSEIYLKKSENDERIRKYGILSQGIINELIETSNPTHRFVWIGWINYKKSTRQDIDLLKNLIKEIDDFELFNDIQRYTLIYYDIFHKFDEEKKKSLLLNKQDELKHQAYLEAQFESENIIYFPDLRLMIADGMIEEYL
jgi:hypothetical protein